MKTSGSRESDVQKAVVNGHTLENESSPRKRFGQTALSDASTQQQAIQNSPLMIAQRKTQERCFGPERLMPAQKKENKTGMPDVVKVGMEAAHNADFSDVRIHPSSSKAPEVGALAYTQGTDIHFAPGQFSPDTGSGKSLLGHELTHVVQQRQGRVQPTTEVNGMPVNDNPALEKEADVLGKKASSIRL